MNELQTVQMEAFIDRNGYDRIGFEDYRGQRVFVAERFSDNAWDVIWSTMGVRRYLKCVKTSTQADRQSSALIDAKGFIDAALVVSITRH